MAAVLVFLVPLILVDAQGAVLTLQADRDVTLFEDPNGTLASGSGPYLFTGVNSSGLARRAIVRFDVAAGLPAGSIVRNVSLRLNLSRNSGGAHAVAVHRALASWGEGGSFSTGGGGASSLSGDATWIHRYYDTSFWAAPGGDFDLDSRAARIVDPLGPYTWSTDALVDDVQDWIDDPTLNHGWILIGDEISSQTAKRFDSRENADASVRPSLEIAFDPPAGAVPDGDLVGGDPLVVNLLEGGSIELIWSASCSPTDSDYAIYEGALESGGFAAHAPRVCSTGGADRWTIPSAAGDHYYLVVPHNGVLEGSYGRNSLGAERVPSPWACLPQAVPTACPQPPQNLK